MPRIDTCHYCGRTGALKVDARGLMACESCGVFVREIEKRLTDTHWACSADDLERALDTWKALHGRDYRGVVYHKAPLWFFEVPESRR